MHRAMEAGVDDVAIGALFGLYDWKFDVMGLVHHAWDLEKHFGIGPHTVSFPRMQPAPGSFLSEHSPYIVSDDAMKRVVSVLRLSIPSPSRISMGISISRIFSFRRRLPPDDCLHPQWQNWITASG